MFAEVRLRTASDFSGITILRDVSGLSFDSKYADVGAIGFSIPLATAKAIGLDANSVVEVRPNGAAATNMWYGLDSSQGTQTVDGASLLAVTGKSLINWLADGIVYPSTWHYSITPADYTVSVNGTRTQVVPRFYITVSATATLTDSTNLITTPLAHSLSVGDKVQFATIVTTTGIGANHQYYVLTAPTSTTFTVSATLGGPVLNLITNGTATGLTKTVLSSDTSQTTIGGHAFENATPGFILKTLVARCVERGGMGWLDVSSFTGTTASDSTAWNTTLTTQYANGTTLLQVIQDLSARHLIEYHMDGNALKVYNSGDSITHWTADQITFRRGKQVTEQTRTLDSSQIADTILIAGDALAIGEIRDTSITTQIGRRREKFVTQGGITDIPTLVTLMGGAELSISGHILTEDTLGIADNDILPWVTFKEGDWVWADFDGTLKNIQIQQISASQQDAGNLQIGMTLGDIIKTADEKNQRLLNNITGQGGGSYGALPNQNTGRPPSDPAAVLAIATAYRDANGVDSDQITVTWFSPTTNIDSTTLTNLDRFEMQYTISGGNIWSDAANIPADNAVVAGFLSNLPTGVSFQARVRAVNSDNYASNWAYSNIIAALPKVLTTPATPATPTVTATIQAIIVNWTGLTSTGAVYDSSWDHTDIYVSTTSGFTPSAANKVGTFSTQGGYITVSGLNYLNTYYAKLITVDKSGNQSAVSATSTGLAPVQVNNGDIANNSINAAMIQNAVITGAKIANGTISTNNLTVASFGDSVAPNGSFEETTTNAGVDTTGAAGWKFLTFPGSANTSTEVLDATGAAAAGTNAIKISIPTGINGAVIGTSSPVPTANPDIWFVSFRARSSSARTAVVGVTAALGDTPSESAGLTHSVNGTNIAGATAEIVGTYPIGTTKLNVSTTWANYEFGFTVPANGVGNPYKWMTLFVGQMLPVSSVAGYDLFIDSVSLRPVGGSASITNLSASKITAGTLNADLLLGGSIKTATSGARVEISNAGIFSYDSLNNVTFSASGGAATFSGSLLVPSGQTLDAFGNSYAPVTQTSITSKGLVQSGSTTNVDPDPWPTIITGRTAVWKIYPRPFFGLSTGTFNVSVWDWTSSALTTTSSTGTVSASAIQTALESCPYIGTGNVTVTGSNFTVTGITITGAGVFVNNIMPPVRIDNSGPSMNPRLTSYPETTGISPFIFNRTPAISVIADRTNSSSTINYARSKLTAAGYVFQVSDFHEGNAGYVHSGVDDGTGQHDTFKRVVGLVGAGVGTSSTTGVEDYNNLPSESTWCCSAYVTTGYYPGTLNFGALDAQGFRVTVLNPAGTTIATLATYLTGVVSTEYSPRGYGTPGEHLVDLAGAGYLFSPTDTNGLIYLGENGGAQVTEPPGVWARVFLTFTIPNSVTAPPGSRIAVQFPTAVFNLFSTAGIPSLWNGFQLERTLTPSRYVDYWSSSTGYNVFSANTSPIFNINSTLNNLNDQFYSTPTTYLDIPTISSNLEDFAGGPTGTFKASLSAFEDANFQGESFFDTIRTNLLRVVGGIALGQGVDKTIITQNDASFNVIGATGQPAFQNSYTATGAGFESPRFYKDALGFVHLEGLINIGAATSATVAFTLPVNYRPRAQQIYTAWSGSSAGTLADVRVAATGTVTLHFATSSGNVSLGGIVFMAES